ncbi:hypothetical protein GXY_11823 [Novacetimonas hansenii ATCC 23769]|uniref:Uncharacterized protein n=1 Tax=Novacetimonas hansenii ATCC 23769 TaxID=714995 RepID=D5QGU2_NOVHA|nr:hypothetical protein GXY_11823 [Novacetimonas hansenii ATCC 23769]
MRIIIARIGSGGAWAIPPRAIHIMRPGDVRMHRIGGGDGGRGSGIACKIKLNSTGAFHGRDGEHS